MGPETPLPRKASPSSEKIPNKSLSRREGGEGRETKKRESSFLFVVSSSRFVEKTDTRFEFRETCDCSPVLSLRENDRSSNREKKTRLKRT